MVIMFVTTIFAPLDEAERQELAARLRRAGERFGDEANLLADAGPEILAAYGLPRDGYHAFYSAAIECSVASVEVLRLGHEDIIPAPCASSVHDWEAEAAERDGYASVMAADLAEQRDMDRAEDEAQRIADVFDEARAEMDRGL